MTHFSIDGKSIAKEIEQKCATQAQIITNNRGHAPGLGVLLIGDDPASKIYVGRKEKTAKRLGMHSQIVQLSAKATHHEVITAIEQLNHNPLIDAFLMQLPLPAHLNASTLIEHIDPRKDADGLHPINLGRLLVGANAPRPCTPAGIVKLLQHSQTPLAGAHAVILGRSNIVGKPLALMLLAEHATVTLCHSKTRDLPHQIQQADIVIAAVGKAKFVQGTWVKPGATVIDVGINRVEGRLVGDVDFAAVAPLVRAITPVPGGVGPMTVAMLLENTIHAAQSSIK